MSERRENDLSQWHAFVGRAAWRGGIIVLAGAVMVTVLFMNSAAAQFQSGSDGGAAGATASPQTPVQHAFADVNFNVVRLVPDPNTEGYRMIMTMEETKSPRRMASFVPPEATLMDNMGNIYFLTGSTGVRICAYRKNWDYPASKCMARADWTDLNQLATNIPMPVVMEFAPRDGSVIPETKEMATKLTLNASLAIVDEAGGEANGQKVDIVIPNIASP